VAENPRIEDLRRRVQKDPASIAFAQLAEEHRRAGQLQEAVDVCRAGLAIHPGYLSARVTLGRALVDLNQLDEARGELETVLKSAPENLAAIRGLAEIYHRRGALPEALVQYRAALNLAHNDPDLEQTVNELTRELAPKGRQPVVDGLSFAQMQQELLTQLPAPAPRAAPPPPAPPAAVFPDLAQTPPPSPHMPQAHAPLWLPLNPEPPRSPIAAAAPSREQRTIDALEHWLVAIHATRPDRHS
jgi:tetratricopeptide (TPR) repeat protein